MSFLNYDRFEGVPSNHKSNTNQSKIDDMEDYYDSLSHICSGMCAKYGPETRNGTYHICAYFNKDKIIMGESSTRQLGYCPISIHAEMDVLRKIYKNNSISMNSKRIEKFDILVIRISKTGKLGPSRPCFHCINSMMNTPIVKIQYVYYSTIDGKIVREKLDTMLESEMTVVSTGWRARTNKNKKRNKCCSHSDSSSDNFSDSSSDNSSDSDSSGSPRTTSPKSSSNKMMQVIDTFTGERRLITELQFQKDALRHLHKSN